MSNCLVNASCRGNLPRTRPLSGFASEEFHFGDATVTGRFEP